LVFRNKRIIKKQYLNIIIIYYILLLLTQKFENSYWKSIYRFISYQICRRDFLPNQI